MKARLFAVMLAAFALCSAASAQPYFIRAEGRNNLRSCAGFGCRVVETAPVGTVLEVVGEYNRWLKIVRDGAEVWMANWIDYSRVEPDELTSSPPATNVDNCCFVDRQCSSDEEWASGFWAFQNNQCAAPAASLPQTLSPPASVDPSQIDNCCFLDWMCVTDDDWLSGFHAYQMNQCKHPGVIIEGSVGFTAQMEAALDMLKDRAPQWYDYVISGLDKIVQDYPRRPGVVVETRTFYLDYGDDPPVGFTAERHTIVTASILVHEACHVYRHQAGFPYGTNAEIIIEERACVQVELEAADVMDIYNKALEQRQSWRTLIENIENPENWWWVGEY